MNRSFLIAGIAATTLVLGACASKPKELPPEPGTANTQTTQPPMQPTGPVPGSQADFMASVMSDTVLFDLDRYNIDASDQGILQSQAQWLARYPAKAVTIEGHCGRTRHARLQPCAGRAPRQCGEELSRQPRHRTGRGSRSSAMARNARSRWVPMKNRAGRKNRRAVTVTVN